MRQAPRKCGVPPLRRALGLPHPGVSAVSREGQGQGRAPDPLPPRQFLLRARVHRGRASRCAAPRLAGRRGKAPGPSHDAGRAARALRGGRSHSAPTPGQARLPPAGAARGADDPTHRASPARPDRGWRTDCAGRRRRATWPHAVSTTRGRVCRRGGLMKLVLS